MKAYEFFHKYANIPLKDRMRPITFKGGEKQTLNQVYKELSNLEEYMRPMRLREDILLKQAEALLDENPF